MRVLQIVLAVVVVFDLSAVSANEKLQVEVTKGEEGEDIVTIKNENGEVLSTNDFHLETGYELQKPNDEKDNVCLILRILEMKMKGFNLLIMALSECTGNQRNKFNGVVPENKQACYSRETVPDDLEHGLDLEECENREIFLLVPADCPDDKSVRGYCRWVTQLECYCAEKTCLRKGWWGWGCTRWGCKRYAYHTVKTKKCY